MSGETFILKPSGRGRVLPPYRYVTCDDLRVVHPERRRDTGRRVGPARIVEGTGRYDHSIFHVAPREPIRRADGIESGSPHQWIAAGAATAAGVKGIVRRLREREAGELATLDEQIAATARTLQDLRDKRSETVARAWATGHVVTLAELQGRAVEASY